MGLVLVEQARLLVRTWRRGEPLDGLLAALAHSVDEIERNRTHPVARRYRDAARRFYEREGEIALDDGDAPLVAIHDPLEGAYVMAWVWVSAKEAGIDPDLAASYRDAAGR